MQGGGHVEDKGGRKVGGRGRKVGGKKAISCSFWDPPEKPSPCFFENPFFRQLIKINQYNYNCTSSIYSVPVQKNCTKGKNCTTTYAPLWAWQWLSSSKTCWPIGINATVFWSIIKTEVGMPIECDVVGLLLPLAALWCQREVQILLKRYLERPELFEPLPARQTSQDLQQSVSHKIYCQFPCPVPFGRPMLS